MTNIEAMKTAIKRGDHFEPLRAAIRAVLEHPENRPWTYHGLGMIRCYPFGGRTWRLNVWNKNFKIVPPASELHTHPWHLHSFIIAGQLTNQRYREIGTPRLMNASEVYLKTDFTDADEYQFKDVACGDQLNVATGGEGRCTLGVLKPEVYVPGQCYSQLAHEIHATDFKPGTVTLMAREEIPDAPCVAKIYWPFGEQWVDAAPRPATDIEIGAGCGVALREWNTGWSR